MKDLIGDVVCSPHLVDCVERSYEVDLMVNNKILILLSSSDGEETIAMVLLFTSIE